MLFNVEYNTNSYNKSHNIANKFRQNPRRHVDCLDWKNNVFRLFIFSNGAILPRGDYGALVKLEVTYIGALPWAHLTLTSITAPSFDFVLKKLKWWNYYTGVNISTISSLCIELIHAYYCQFKDILACL